MNNRKLTWRHLKALHDLYQQQKTSARILDNAYIRSLRREKRLIGWKPGNDKILLAHTGYKEYYQQQLREPFLAYHAFLTDNRIDTNARQHFDEYDIEAFMFISTNKAAIKNELTTIRHFSSLFFREKGSKYLEKHPGISRIVCKLLEIDTFPDQDPKTNAWRFVVDHPSPRLVVFCENLANLKRPWIAHQEEWELWYVGGNNIGIVEQIGQDKLNIPIYYSCDWDLAGLQIYSRLRKIFSDKGCFLHLLEPHDKQAILDVRSPDHNSFWKRDVPYSGLHKDVFNGRQLALIADLIASDTWIEEESQDLSKSLEFNIQIQNGTGK
jgi:hypothetical protein